MTFSRKTNKNQMFGARLIYMSGEVPGGQMENVDKQDETEREKQNLLDLLGDPALTAIRSSARENLKKFYTGDLANRLNAGEQKVYDIFSKCQDDINRLDRSVMAVHEFLGGSELRTSAAKMKQLANQCWMDTQLTKMIGAGRVAQIGYTADRHEPLEAGDITYKLNNDEGGSLDVRFSGYDIYVNTAGNAGEFQPVNEKPPFTDVSHPVYKPKAAPKTPVRPPEGSDLNA